MGIGKKQRIVIIIIVFLWILFLAGIVVGKEISYREYIGTEAEIASVTSEPVGDLHVHYVTYKYESNGQSYLTKKQIGLKILYKEGKRVKIRYNPENPSQIANNLLINTCLIVAVLSLIWNIGMIISTKEMR